MTSSANSAALGATAHGSASDNPSAPSSTDGIASCARSQHHHQLVNLPPCLPGNPLATQRSSSSSSSSSSSAGLLAGVEPTPLATVADLCK